MSDVVRDDLEVMKSVTDIVDVAVTVAVTVDVKEPYTAMSMIERNALLVHGMKTTKTSTST
jgi:hypothetical protein